MSVNVVVPAVGESVSEGILAAWLKRDGDRVRADEPLFQLETEKATTDVVSPADGILAIDVPEGRTVAIGAVVGRIQPTPVDPSASPAASPPYAVDVSNGAGQCAAASTSSFAATTGASSEHLERPLPPRDFDVPLSPSLRRLARQRRLDLRQLQGSGPGGRILERDLIASAGALRPVPTPPTPAPAQHQPTPAASRGVAGASRRKLSPIRQRIAERLVAAKNTAALLTTFNEADLSAILDLRQRFKESFQKKHGVSLGFMSFFVKAVVEAIHAFPELNHHIEGNEVVDPGRIDVGVAVSTDRGLMVPVLRDADRLSFADIERRIAELAGKARDGRIGVDDLQGGTFTITNGGVFGSLLSTPIVNPPQSGILGMHAIQRRPVAVGDQVAIRPMMYLALTYDHRLIDGREAVGFLVRVKECVEHPERILLEI